MALAKNEMWQAVVGCDEAYDGQFFYAVKTVGVYCRPSCKSRTPLQKNTLYFQTQEDALTAGFRPCKRCHPDLLKYDPVLELVHQTKSLIDDYYQNRKQLASKLKQLGVTQSHLSAVFKQKYGTSPIQYLNEVRALYAKNLLEDTDLPIVEVAGEIGFDSLAAFYHFFKKQTGTTPKKHRVQSRCHKTEE